MEQARLGQHVLEHHPRAEAVHEARKATKRGRAVVAICARALDPKAERRLRRGFRDAAALVAPMRDRDVLRGHLQALGIEGPVLPPPIEDESLLVESARRFAEVAAEAESADLAGALRGPVLAGLKRVYSRGRAAMVDALRSRTVEGLHEWRKKSKGWRYALDLVFHVDPDGLGSAGSAAEALGEVLGTHQDLSLLEVALGDMGESDALLAVEGRRRTLQERAFELGEAVYADRPKEVLLRLSAAWDAWRT